MLFRSEGAVVDISGAGEAPAPADELWVHPATNRAPAAKDSDNRDQSGAAADRAAANRDSLGDCMDASIDPAGLREIESAVGENTATAGRKSRKRLGLS